MYLQAKRDQTEAIKEKAMSEILMADERTKLDRERMQLERDRFEYEKVKEKRSEKATMKKDISMTLIKEGKSAKEARDFVKILLEISDDSDGRND